MNSPRAKTPPAPHDLAGIAVRAAEDAGELLRSGQRTARIAVAATKSSLVDIVTELDRESEKCIVSAIRQARPYDAILGEEGTCVDGSTGVRWVIDPLDGTVNFTYGLPMYAVSIGIEIDGVAMAGAVLNPATRQLWTAVKGEGALLDGSPIEPRPAPPLSEALIATGFGYERQRRIEQVDVFTRVLPEVRDIRRCGAAALDICSVASGLIDGFYERGIKKWDFCAGEVIAGEAGATVTAFDGGRPEGDVIVARREIHAQLQRLINRSA